MAADSSGLAASPFRFLSEDTLRLVLAAVGPEYAWLAALACRAFHARLHADATPARRRRRTIRFSTPVSVATESIALLSWATTDGCGWDSALTCAYAAAAGRLEVLQAARKRGAHWSAWTPASAALGGHIAVLEWLLAERCPWSTLVCEAAAGAGQLATLQWLRARGCGWNADASLAAARGGHLDLLRWARANGCPIGKHASSAAAIGGHIAVLEWLLQHGCRLNAMTATAAVAGGHLDLLRALCEAGLKPQHAACEAAARRGDLLSLQYLRARRVPWRVDCSFCAAAYGHLHILQFIASVEDRPIHTLDAWRNIAALALSRGHAEVAQWVVNSGYVGAIALDRCTSTSALALKGGVDEGAAGEGLGAWAPAYAPAFARRRARAFHYV